MKQQLNDIYHRIENAAQDCGRQPETIQLVAVSKTVSSEKIKEAAAAGVTDIGENYIQESKKKFVELSDLDLRWHFIGHLQSNKAKFAVRIFDLIHSVDSFKLAQALNKQAKKIDKIQNILVQINLSKEPTKFGIEEQSLKRLLIQIGELENISVKGLMTMPPFFNSPESVRPYFSSLRKLRNNIQKEALPNIFLKELSMGMTGDFEVAVREGATMVRIGTAIFGDRN